MCVYVCVWQRATAGMARPRPASSLGFQSLSPEQQQRVKRLSHSNDLQLLDDGPPQPPAWLQLQLEAHHDVTMDDG